MTNLAYKTFILKLKIHNIIFTQQKAYIVFEPSTKETKNQFMNNPKKFSSFTLTETDVEFEMAKYDMGIFCRRNDIQLDQKTVQEIEVQAFNILRN